MELFDIPQDTKQVGGDDDDDGGGDDDGYDG